jgi:cell division protein FtsB
MRSRRADPWYLRVRWDRVGRLALLVTLGGVLLLYVGPARSYISTWRTAGGHRANIARLEGQNRALRAERRALHDPRTLERRARALGMVRSDERSYVVMGLPRDR